MPADTSTTMIELPTISPDETKKRKPDWLRVKLPVGPEYAKVRKLVDNYKLHTICEVVRSAPLPPANQMNTMSMNHIALPKRSSSWV
jgi:lipoate synthase